MDTSPKYSLLPVASSSSEDALSTAAYEEIQAKSGTVFPLVHVVECNAKRIKRGFIWNEVKFQLFIKNNIWQ